MKSKKVLIFGPIGDYGGRDVEVNIIAKALQAHFEVDIISSEYMTKASFALKDITDTVFFSTLDKELKKRDGIIGIGSFLSALRHGFKKGQHAYVANTFSKQYLNYYDKRLKLLLELLKDYDVVILPVQLTTQFLRETIEFCKANSIKTIIRTTGTMFKVPQSIIPTLEKVDLFIHHSESNRANLSKHLDHKYVIIDQCSYWEKELLEMELDKQKPLRFGYLGRLSEEKQILPLAELFGELNLPLVIAGDGPQKEALMNIKKSYGNIDYLGLLESDEIDRFFNQIDVLIIASKEETGPLVGVEAMASGKIIVSTRVGAMSERLESSQNDFWFSIDSLSTIKPILITLNSLPKDKLEVIGTKNRDHYKQHYAIENIAKQYFEAVNTCLN